jgi:hypothetical protein
MIDRGARDWLANLVERALSGEYDPGPNPDFLSDRRCRSKDLILDEGSEELAHYCGGKHQLNGWGTTGLILNLEDENRRMRNLITFLKSDVEFGETRSFMTKWGCLVFALALGFAITIFVLSKSQNRVAADIATTIGIIWFALLMVPLFIIYAGSLLIFVVRRWISPPKLQTDEQDPWPFKKVQQLLIERERQGDLSSR